MALYKRRKKFGGFSVAVGRAFGVLKLHPNGWTILSILPALAAAYYLINEQFLIAAGLFIVAAFLDLVDGSVARVTGRVSVFGAYLDTVVDRYVEGIIVFSLLFAALPEFYIPTSGWIVLYLFGGLMTTYVKAAAKEKDLVKKEIKGGILERAERMIVLFAGIVLAYFNPLYLTYVLVLLAVLANVTVIQRILIARGKRKKNTKK